MLNNNPANHYFDYIKCRRHWHALSERYTGGDSLLTALDNGWMLSDIIYAELHWYAGTRCVTIYHFELTRGTETVLMPVITNPYIDRMIEEIPLRIVLADQNNFARTE